MRAIGIREFGGRDKLETLDLPDPEPAPGEVRVHVRSAGVNPVDWKIREGHLKDRMPHDLPVVLGWDVAGVVDGVGHDVKDVHEGDVVFAYCRGDRIAQDGAYADYMCVEAAHCAPKPEALELPDAGAVPLAALTAWQAIHEHLGIQEGETLLVHAAAGGVGTFAVQIARLAGAEVLGTASAKNHAYLRELGVTTPIDYRDQDVAEAVRSAHSGGVDAVLDCVGGETLAKSPALLRDGGRLLSIVERPEGAAFEKRGLRCSWMFVEPSGEQLREIARRIDAGDIRVHVQERYPLGEAAEAHRVQEAGHVRGKLVLVP